MESEQSAGRGGYGSDMGTYRRLLYYTRPYWGRLALGIGFGGLYAAANAGILAFLKHGLPKFFPQGEFYDESAPMRVVILTALVLPLVAVIRGAADFLSRYQIRWVGSRVVMDLRNAMFRRLNELSLSYFVTSRTGELISRTTNDTMAAENAVSVVVEDIAKQPLTLIGAVIWLVWTDPWLALISLVLFPVCIIPVGLFGRRVRRFSREAQRRIADLVSVLQEMITGVRVVKAFGMEDYETGRFREQNLAFFRRVIKVARANAAVEPIIVFISTIGISLVLIYVRISDMPFEDFMTYAGALFMMYEPVKKLSRMHLQIQQAVSAADRIFEVLDAPVDVQDRPGAVAAPPAVETIRFDNVVFSYGDRRILDGISLQVTAGQRIAIVGGSGAGKTTLVNLLPRFYDVTGGGVLINGRDTREFTLGTLRRLMGIVTQDTILFNDTIARNISYGSREAGHGEIMEAAKRANAHEFIMEQPQQYETVIGDLGVRLSGGQKQRLAIARAILRNPPVMILDEATSALDTESERLVQAALTELMEGRTVFAIAHRLSTIANCDRIVVLEGGRIREQGTHDELLGAGGLYKRLYDMQFTAQGTEERMRGVKNSVN